VAAELGMADAATDDGQLPLSPDGLVDVPVWRFARLNFPHPLLRLGLTVLDTPGLNAVGAEPELTLSLLPAAHAAVFLLDADAGVTRSDLAIWRRHLGARALERFAVLNKIDTLADPLRSAQEIETQIQQLRKETSRLLGLPAERVFALSAREALTARLHGDARRLQASRALPLERALADELMPRQQQLLAAAAQETFTALSSAAARQLADRRRHLAEEMLELRGLKGKSASKVRLMQERVAGEAADFERCVSRLQALRAVHLKMQKGCAETLSSEALRAEVATMQSAPGSRWLHLGIAKSFATLMARLRARLDDGQRQSGEMWDMVHGSFEQLNAEVGFSFVLAPLPDLARFYDDLERIEARFAQHLGLTQTWRLTVPGAMDQLCRVLLTRLRVVFETASAELEMWSKAAESQVQMQLRERRRMYRQRAETLKRIQTAAGELDLRLAELDEQDSILRQTAQQLQARVDAALQAVHRPAASGHHATRAVA
jgi:hypothetical protein